MKKMGIFLMILFLFPFSCWAYSNRIIVGGETIGIEVHSKGVYIVGFYSVTHKNLGVDAGFQIGDNILSVDNRNVSTIEDLNHILVEEKTYQFEVLRNEKKKTISLRVIYEDGMIRTGLYVKDQINGIGTLSYIDPETNIYGSLGHEILESASRQKFAVKDGYIYEAKVTSIDKSRNGLTGSKNALLKRKNIYGTVEFNEEEGIFGKYTKEYLPDGIMEVGESKDIHTGKAIIRTVIADNQVREYDIDIKAINEDNSNKNILFEITDKALLQEAGGIVQGMSGSPIIQEDKIIGVVNYVIVEDTKMGYGIFITTMLKKGDEVFS